MKTKTILSTVIALGTIGAYSMDDAATAEFDRIERAADADKPLIFDQIPMQVLGSGTVSNGTAGGFAFAGRGATPARTGAGTYTLTIDNEAGGGAVSANALRVFIQTLTALQTAQAVKTSNTVTTVTTVVSTTGVATDGTFDWLVLKDPTITT